MSYSKMKIKPETVTVSHSFFLYSQIKVFFYDLEVCKHFVGEDKKSSLVTLEQIPVLAQKVGAEWVRIASKLGFQEDEVLFIESEHSSSVIEQARKMLMLWTENEGDDATVHVFTKAVNSLNLTHLITNVFEDADNGSNDSQADE